MSLSLLNLIFRLCIFNAMLISQVVFAAVPEPSTACAPHMSNVGAAAQFVTPPNAPEPSSPIIARKGEASVASLACCIGTLACCAIGTVFLVNLVYYSLVIGALSIPPIFAALSDRGVDYLGTSIGAQSIYAFVALALGLAYAKSSPGFGVPHVLGGISYGVALGAAIKYLTDNPQYGMIDTFDQTWWKNGALIASSVGSGLALLGHIIDSSTIRAKVAKRGRR